MQTLISKSDLKNLYEIDDFLWLQETIKLLKDQSFYELDLNNLIEELENLGSERKNAVSSLLQQIIIHTLLLEYWYQEYERNKNHWQSEITVFRYQIEDKLTTNFRNFLQENLQQIYHRAKKIVSKKTGFSLNSFPSNCPYTLEQLLDEDWFPNN